MYIIIYLRVDLNCYISFIRVSLPTFPFNKPFTFTDSFEQTSIGFQMPCKPEHKQLGKPRRMVHLGMGNISMGSNFLPI